MSYSGLFKKTPTNWRIDVIDNLKSDAKNAIAMGPFGSRITRDNFVDKGVPIIRGNNLKSFKFNEADFVFVTEEKAKDLSASIVRRGDIVITHRGTLGQVGYIPNSSKYERYIVSQSGMKLSCNPEKIDSKFLWYFLNSRVGQHLLLSNKSQVGVPSIARPTTTLKKTPVPVPPLPIQRRIAAILSSLDDKIENNRKTCEKLETIAQAIFKRWFVEERTDEWEIQSLNEVANITMGQSPPSSTYNYDNEGLPFFQGSKEFGWRKPVVDKWCNESKRIAEQGSILISVRAPVGDMNIAAEECCIGRGLAAIQGNRVPTSVLYYAISDSIKTIKNMSSGGSVFDSLNKKTLAEVKVAIPPDELKEKYYKTYNSIFTKINLLDDESKKLAQTRDALLHKLMSGELAVDDVGV